MVVFSATAAATPLVQSMDIDLQTYTTPRGITFWYVQDSTLPFVDIRADFLTGTDTDPPQYVGATNFLSGMLDEGAGHLSSAEFQEALRDTFASFGVQAGRDVFSVSIRTLTEKQEEALALVGLALNEPRFDDAPMELVRRQIIAGIREDEQDPNYLAGRVWAKAVFGDHIYARPRAGTVSSVETISALVLRQQAKRVFRRDRLKLAVVGDIDFDTLPDLIDNVFADMPADTPTPTQGEAIWQPSPSVQVVDFPNPQSVVLAGMPTLGVHDADFFAIFLANAILGGSGFSSRLMQEVREERGLVYGVGSSLSQRRYANVMFMQAQTRNTHVAETIEILREQVSNMITNGVTETELANAKSYLTGSYVLRFNSNAGIANQLSGLQQLGLPPSYLNTRNAQIAAVTKEGLHAAVQRWFDVDKLRFVVVGEPEGIDQAPRVQLANAVGD